MNLKYIVTSNNYKNINQILKQELNISARLQQKLIKSHHVYLNSVIVDTRSSVSLNDVISVNLNFEEESKNIIPTSMALDIIYEDDCFLVLNKPAGIAVHPSILHYTDSLANGVKHYFDKIGLKRRKELKSKIRAYNKRIKKLQELAASQEIEYLAKEKQISTFLECKKSFFGKVKYYFKYSKKSSKKAENQEIEDEIRGLEKQINNLENQKNRYLIKLSELTEFEETEIIEESFEEIETTYKALTEKFSTSESTYNQLVKILNMN